MWIIIYLTLNIKKFEVIVLTHTKKIKKKKNPDLLGEVGSKNFFGKSWDSADGRRLEGVFVLDDEPLNRREETTRAVEVVDNLRYLLPDLGICNLTTDGIEPSLPLRFVGVFPTAFLSLGGFGGVYLISPADSDN